MRRAEARVHAELGYRIRLVEKPFLAVGPSAPHADDHDEVEEEHEEADDE